MPFNIGPNTLTNDDVEISTNDDGDLVIVDKQSGEPISIGPDGLSTESFQATNADIESLADDINAAGNNADGINETTTNRIWSDSVGRVHTEFQVYDDSLVLQIPDKDWVEINLEKLSPNADAGVRLHVSTDGGETWYESSTDYRFTRREWKRDGTEAHEGSGSGASEVRLIGDQVNDTDLQNAPLSLEISKPHESEQLTYFKWDGASNYVALVNGVGSFRSEEPVTAIRISRSDGGWMSAVEGRMTVYPGGSEETIDGEMLIENGVWLNQHRPRALHAEEVGETFIGTTDSYGKVHVSSYDHDTGDVSMVELDDLGTADDHSNPAIYRRDDDNLIALWSGHGSQSAVDEMRYAITQTPLDISTFGETQSFGGDGTYRFYPWVVPYNGNLRLYFRKREGSSDDGAWHWRESTDNGETWGTESPMFLGWGDWTYPMVVHENIESGDRIHFVTGDHRETDSAIRHFYLEDGDFHTSDGAVIQNEETTITDPSVLTEVHGSGAVKVYDVVVDDDTGNIYIGFTRHVQSGSGGGDGDYRAMWAMWDGDSWRSSEVTEMGGALPETHYYEAGLDLDPKDPTKMMVGVEAENRNYQIQEWQTSDNGNSWTKIQNVSADHPEGINPEKRLRPIYPDNYADDLRELWCGGDYSDYNAFNMRVMTSDN